MIKIELLDDAGNPYKIAEGEKQAFLCHTQEYREGEKSYKSKGLLSMPDAKKILASIFCYCSMEKVAGLWGSSYMVMYMGVSAAQAASVISIFFFAITGGRFLSGLLTEKWEGKIMIRTGQVIAIIGCITIIGSS